LDTQNTEETQNRLGFQKTNLTDENLVLNELYAEVRKLRESGPPRDSAPRILSSIFERLESHHPDDWLLRWEILEIDHLWQLNSPWKSKVLSRLAAFASKDKESEQLIRRGLELLK
jgi:hypothetical protein